MIIDYKIVLFTYDFPHRKTNDFIDIIYQNKFNISLILAANYIEISTPKSAFNLKKHQLKTSAQETSKKLNIPYYQVQHNSQKTQDLLKKYNINFGIIAGARILHKSIIKMLKYGILNFHPGLLPKVRGLDSILWAIYYDYHIGVTAHLINEKIDAGKLIIRKKINISSEDDITTLYQKNYLLQLNLIPISLNLIFDNQYFKKLNTNSKYNTHMPYDKQVELLHKINSYVNRFAER